MAGCLQANLEYEIKANGTAESNTCDNSTSCSRPAFSVMGPQNGCVTVITEAIGKSSKYSGYDYEEKTFYAGGVLVSGAGADVVVPGSVKVFRLGPNC